VGVSSPRTFSETAFLIGATLKVVRGILGVGKMIKTAFFKEKEVVKEVIVWIAIGATIAFMTGFNYWLR